MPPRPKLQRIREAIDDDHRGLAAILREPATRRRFGGLAEEHMLTRMPRGANSAAIDSVAWRSAALADP